MRCLGRLVFGVFLLLLLGVGWLYRAELMRWGRRVLDPGLAERSTGRPSLEAAQSAEKKVDSLVRFRPDSILLTANEMAALFARGATLLPEAPLDSISVELGNRTIRVRTVVNTARLPARYRDMIPGTPAPYEEVIAAGTLTPVRDGLAELQLDRVLVRGLPVPSDMVARIIGRITGRESDGRLIVAMPRGVTGFRVRPEGVAIYRSGGVP